MKFSALLVINVFGLSALVGALPTIPSDLGGMPLVDAFGSGPPMIGRPSPKPQASDASAQSAENEATATDTEVVTEIVTVTEAPRETETQPEVTEEATEVVTEVVTVTQVPLETGTTMSEEATDVAEETIDMVEETEEAEETEETEEAEETEEGTGDISFPTPPIEPPVTGPQTGCILKPGVAKQNEAFCDNTFNKDSCTSVYCQFINEDGSNSNPGECIVIPGQEPWEENCILSNDQETCLSYAAFCTWEGPEESEPNGDEEVEIGCVLKKGLASEFSSFCNAADPPESCGGAYCNFINPNGTKAAKNACTVKEGQEAFKENCITADNQKVCEQFEAFCEWTPTSAPAPAESEAKPEEPVAEPTTNKSKGLSGYCVPNMEFLPASLTLCTDANIYDCLTVSKQCHWVSEYDGEEKDFTLEKTKDVLQDEYCIANDPKGIDTCSDLDDQDACTSEEMCLWLNFVPMGEGDVPEETANVDDDEETKSEEATEAPEVSESESEPEKPRRGCVVKAGIDEANKSFCDSTSTEEECTSSIFCEFIRDDGSNSNPLICKVIPGQEPWGENCLLASTQAACLDFKAFCTWEVRS